jgi:LPXTG-site transpeptidase (sortase) family protein
VGSFLTIAVWQGWQNRVFDHSRVAGGSRAKTRIENGEILGRLVIPRLHVQSMIREGADSEVLSVALGHIPGTALPGQQGNIGIAGHRDTLFRGLRNVRKNDEITFETAHATYIYRVKSSEIVKPTDVAVLNPGTTDELTLVTCFPFYYVGSAPDRFIVKAELVSGNNVPNENTPNEAAPQRFQAERAVPPRPKPVPQGEIPFDVAQGHSRALVPGKIWFGLDSADASGHTLSGWLWVMPDQRTIWLRDADAHEPFVFYQNGAKHELFITSLNGASARGYMVTLPDRG